MISWVFFTDPSLAVRAAKLAIDVWGDFVTASGEFHGRQGDFRDCLRGESRLWHTLLSVLWAQALTALRMIRAK